VCGETVEMEGGEEGMEGGGEEGEGEEGVW